MMHVFYLFFQFINTLLDLWIKDLCKLRGFAVDTIKCELNNLRLDNILGKIENAD